MAEWVLVPSLKSLRAEIDAIAPARSKTSDGSIGDPAHASRSSDHNPDETGVTPDEDSDSINEVHAIDVDKDLNQAGLTMEMIVQFLVGECRKPGTSGKDKGRLKYIIYNRRIWEASNGWNERTYTGSNPHTEHAHCSGEYDSKYSQDTSAWGLIERFETMAISNEDVKKIWEGVTWESPYDGQARYPISYLRYAPSRDGITNAVFARIDPELTALDNAVAGVSAKQDAQAQQIADLTAKMDHLIEILGSHVAGIIEGRQE